MRERGRGGEDERERGVTTIFTLASGNRIVPSVCEAVCPL